MRIWIDILTPKQVYFFMKLEQRLKQIGHEVLNTTRCYREVNQVLEMKGINAVIVGKHGGSTLEGKLMASAQRTVELTQVVTKFQPDLSIAFGSPEAARTSYGLAIPHYTVNDSPHSEAVARLTVPLSKKLFTLRIIPKKLWVKFGADPNSIVQYDALDPIVWLKKFLPDYNVLTELGITDNKPIVVFRLEESFASYLSQFSEKESVILPFIHVLLDDCGGSIHVVALPRYIGQQNIIEKTFGDKVIVPKKVVDCPSLLSFSSVFVGAGGTMTAEASLLGVPTISCYPGEPTLVERYLVRKRLVSRITNPEKATKKVLQILNEIELFKRIQQERATLLTSSMEDPLTVILTTIGREHSFNISS